MKTYKVTQEEFGLLQKAQMKESALAKEQMAYNREWGVKKNELLLVHKQRTIDYKQNQIDTNTFTESSEAFKDGVKPTFLLQNEIEEIRFDMAQIRVNTDKIKEEMAKENESNKE